MWVGTGETYVNSNGRVVIEFKGNNAENNTEKKKRNMTYINDKDEQVVIEDRCGEGKLCCIQRVGEDAEVEQSIAKHRVKAIAEEIIDEIISMAEKIVKSAPDDMVDESIETDS